MRISLSQIALSLLGFLAIDGSPAFGKDLENVGFPELGFSGQARGEITVYFNPKEYTVTKSTPWKHHDIQGLDAPTLEFTSGEPYRCQFELFFDRYEEGKSVREITDKIEKLAIAANDRRPPLVLMSWGNGLWVTRLLRAETMIVDTLPDGTPVAASVRTLWSEFVPAETVANPDPVVLLAASIAPSKGQPFPLAVDSAAVELLELIAPPTEIAARSILVSEARPMAPRVSFTSGEPYRLRVPLVIDATPNQPLCDLVAQAAKLLQDGALLDVGIGGLQYKCILESFSLRFTLFLDDGTPVRAVMNTTFKEFKPAEEQLRGNPRH